VTLGSQGLGRFPNMFSSMFYFHTTIHFFESHSPVTGVSVSNTTTKRKDSG
jgi:hypothetical protein